MTYVSPFNELIKKNAYTESYAKRHQSYLGNLEEIFNRIEQREDKKNQEYKPTIKEIYQRIMDPPRIIKALIDYKIKNPNVQNMHSLINNSIDFALNEYLGLKQTKEEAEKLNQNILNNCGEAIFLEAIVQKFDTPTFYAQNPEKSRDTVRKLTYFCNKQPILLIALAHGGIASGMDVYLEYTNLTKQKEKSLFYPIRCSKYKYGDNNPQISKEEKEFLQKNAEDKIVVIFDEDTCTGRTLKNAKNFFKEEIFPYSSIKIASNMDLFNLISCDGEKIK